MKITRRTIHAKLVAKIMEGKRRNLPKIEIFVREA
jgi:hypothetical protein